MEEKHWRGSELFFSLVHGVGFKHEPGSFSKRSEATSTALIGLNCFEKRLISSKIVQTPRVEVES